MAEQEQKDTVTVIRPPDAPPAPPCQTVCMADLTPEEREKFTKGCCPKFRKHVREYGGYDMAKRDSCKEMREAEEAKKKQKEEEVEALQKRNAILEAAARQQEAKQKEQEERLKKAEERMEKMASLLAQLISK